jgi:hypothetical protein
MGKSEDLRQAGYQTKPINSPANGPPATPATIVAVITGSIFGRGAISTLRPEVATIPETSKAAFNPVPQFFLFIVNYLLIEKE